MSVCLSKVQTFTKEIFATIQLDTYFATYISLSRALFGYEKNSNTLKLVETGGTILSWQYIQFSKLSIIYIENVTCFAVIKPICLPQI